MTRFLSACAMVLMSLLSACDRKPDPVQQPKLTSLDALFAFSEPANCIPGKPLQRLLDKMVEIKDADRPIALGVVEVPPELRGSFGTVRLVRGARDFPRTTYSRAIGESYEFAVPIRGTWLGLPLREVRRDFVMGSDVGGFTIVFDAPADIVRTKLAAAGFKPPSVGGYRFTDTDFAGAMNLNVVSRRTELGC